MSKHYKLFNESNPKFDEINDRALEKEQVEKIKNRVSKRLNNRRKNVRRTAIISAVVMFLILVPLISNRSVLANISKSFVNSFNKVSGNKVSHEVIIYSTHNYEKYENGMSVVEVGEKISDELNGIQIDSFYLNGDEIKFDKAYKYYRELIQSKIEDYDESFLIDVHRMEKDMEENIDVEFSLAKSNPYYKECKILTEKLSSYIEENSELKVKITTYDVANLNSNQDLSTKSISVNLGNDMDSEDRVNEIIDVFIRALDKVIS